MKVKLTILILSCFLFQKLSYSQDCTALGQNPQTAFPVCGTATFSQSSVNICGNRTIVSQCSSGTPLFTDKNPYWYKFTCFTTGTLGFVITPNNLGDDYDWQLFDVTNRNVANVYTDLSMFVACNWSGEPGITGASSAGTSLVRCEGPGVPLFSSMPTIIQGRQYLLLVSHFTDSQSGYSLSFGGGTASITDPTEPHLTSASAACDGTVITVKLNKRMKCRSLATNGSDFSISPAVSNIVSATGIGCNLGFDMDSLRLTLSGPLTPGNYTITIGNGIDGNTILDNCDRNIPVGENIPLTVLPIAPTPMDSLVKPGCAPQELELVFRKQINCNSIAADGSDFAVTGTYPVTVVSASGVCVNGLTRSIKVRLSAPLQRAGNFRITLRTGSDGNTLLDECTQESVPGQFISFTVVDTVNADFTYAVTLGCNTDVIQYNHPANNGVNSWLWTFGDVPPSILQNPVVNYTLFGIKQTRLIVTNGVCYDTSFATINLGNKLKAGFEGPEFICPNDVANFRDTSRGQIINWSWDFGNGSTASGQTPPAQTYLNTGNDYDVMVRLIVKNNIGCLDTAYKKIKVVRNCYIAVPSAFTPNGDGLNDYLYPLNAYKAKSLRFSVYNRFGQRIFYTTDWTSKWNGYFNRKPADAGTYVWTLQYYDPEKAKQVEQKGTTVLIR
jgi:gliding motility-associated-like protein